MTRARDDDAASGYARVLVPAEAQGSGWKVFFIVAGSLCGLPAFILGARVSGGLGFARGAQAVLFAATLLAVLGGLSAFAGSRTRMGLALLSDAAFGPMGGRLVKLVLMLSLIGWFGVGVSVLGATASHAIAAMGGPNIPTFAISIPLTLAIAGVAILGVSGLERLGMVIVPLAAAILAGSVALTVGQLGRVLDFRGTGAVTFGGAISAIVGSFIVGILVQPDYGRFVRRPIWAALGAGAALGLAYPVVLITSSIASVALDRPDLISAMIVLGFGAPALLILSLGAWIDASASLYSGALSLTNQVRRLTLTPTVIGIAVLGVALDIAHAETAFVPFLQGLGVGLPPVAAVLIAEALVAAGGGHPLAIDRRIPLRLFPAAAWIAGTGAGVLESLGLVRLTSIAALDSMLAAVVVIVIGLLLRPVLPERWQ